MNWPLVLLLTAAVSTFFCTAVNCYTLRVAYPLWRWVGPAEFGALHSAYLRLLGPVITFPHIVLFFATGALLRWGGGYLPLRHAAWLFALAATVVGVSAFWAGPIHSRFARTGLADEPGLRRLLQISALRSLLMLAASGIVCRALYLSLAAPERLSS